MNKVLKLSCAYNDPLALLRDYCPDIVETMTESEQDALSGSITFECLLLYVYGGNTVLTVDPVTNDVLGEDSLADFARESIAWAKENS